MFNGSSVLITGGTGSFGRYFIREALKKFPRIKRLVVYSRDELKQFEMMQEFSNIDSTALRFFIGDVRDKERLKSALNGIDYVVHAAALKQVPAAEYNPFECIKTNILGAQNLIECAMDSTVKKILALSTDKAAAPINLYGATKLASDKLFISANNIKGSRDISFSVLRYGNVMGSRGSVIPFFQKHKASGTFPITSPEMTRFNITLAEGINIALDCLNESVGGEIFVPKLPSYNIMDLAEAICPKCTKKIIGIRPGEKIHEEMVTTSDAYYTKDIGQMYVILPADYENKKSLRKRYSDYKIVPVGFSYNSGQNTDRLSIKQLKNLIALNC
jgi:UDP-N-acetylglucosamine 4,6-dehydratase (inverting)